MKLSQRDVSHGWSKVKHHIGRAWHSGKQILSTADRYATVAAKVLTVASPLLSKEIQDRGKAGLQMYARGRGQVEDAVNKYEGVYGRLQRSAPEIFWL